MMRPTAHVRSFGQTTGPDLSEVGTSNADDLRAALRGSVAALINVGVTFPVNKLIFRQQVGAVSLREAAKSLAHDGFFYLWRGMAPPLMQQMVSKAIMFGLYEKYSTFFSRMLLRQHDEIDRKTFKFHSNGWKTSYDFSIGLAAASCAGLSELVLLPFERVQTVMQLNQYHNKYRNTAHAFQMIGRHGRGFREYYRGLSACATRNVIGNVVFFGCRGHLHDYIDEHTRQSCVDRHGLMPMSAPAASTSFVSVGSRELANDFLSGACLGAAISVVTFPLNVTKAIMQRTIGGQFVFLTTAFAQAYTERGRSIRMMYTGVGLNIVRSFMSWGIISITIGLLKNNNF